MTQATRPASATCHPDQVAPPYFHHIHAQSQLHLGGLQVELGLQELCTHRLGENDVRYPVVMYTKLLNKRVFKIISGVGAQKHTTLIMGLFGKKGLQMKRMAQGSTLKRFGKGNA